MIEPVDEIASLPVSENVLNYYKEKLRLTVEENDEISKKLDCAKNSWNVEFELETKLFQTEANLAKLQEGLSDGMAKLYEEKDHVMKLNLENNELKVRCSEYEDKLHHLCNKMVMCNPDQSQSIYAFANQSDGFSEFGFTSREPMIVYEKQDYEFEPFPEENENGDEEGVELDETDEYTKKLQIMNKHLADRVRMLTDQLEEQSRLANERVEALTEDKRVRQMESDRSKRTAQEDVSRLLSKLSHTKSILFQSTVDYLNLRKENLAMENKLLYMLNGNTSGLEPNMCPNCLRLSLDECKGKATDVKGSKFGVAASKRSPFRPAGKGVCGKPNLKPLTASTADVCVRKSRIKRSESTIDTRKLVHDALETPTYPKELEDILETARAGVTLRDLQITETRLEQSKRVTELYKTKCCQLEACLSEVQNKLKMSTEEHQVILEKLQGQLALLRKWYERLNQRRKLEVCGFKTHLGELQQEVASLEKQLFKMAMIISANNCGDTKLNEGNIVPLAKANSKANRIEARLGGLKNQLAYIKGQLTNNCG